jgi:cell division septal protein FtsQ
MRKAVLRKANPSIAFLSRINMKRFYKMMYLAKLLIAVTIPAGFTWQKSSKSQLKAISMTGKENRSISMIWEKLSKM